MPANATYRRATSRDSRPDVFGYDAHQLTQLRMMEFPWLRYRFFVCIVVAASPLVSAGNITAKDLTTDWVRPPGPTTSCFVNSLTAPTWSVESFRYEGGHTVSTVSFTLTSNAIREGLRCFGQTTGDGPKVDGDCTGEDGEHKYPAQFKFDASSLRLSIEQTWACDDNAAKVPLNENENRAHNYEVETSMRLVSAEGKLLVNQTWYCDDEGPVSPVKFYATGVVELLNLTCRARLEVEPDVADIYIPSGTPIVNGSVCFGSHFDIDGRIESRYELEPYALELPNPEAPKCTVISMDSDKQFFILDTSYVFRANWWYFEREGEPKGGFDVTIHNFVTERELGCSGFSSRLNPNGTDYDPDYWFECISLPSYPDLIRSIRVNYNSKSGILSVGMSWSCDELSPKSP
ncbi:hypothetical protein NUW58_g4136 [Xylaria curta]|uniref:Uncharacterized protein n=1 Tax=Xylaria curta TaxID=42375 RepID=A0ACC1P7Q6_9PEZI|nr:hypothetical protein NUW58_g4136 [Xylaria curta]